MTQQQFLYFAYGSNMLTKRLQARCPSASVIGAVSVNDYCVTFDKHGSDSSAKANLTHSRGDRCHGVLYEIDPLELNLLDKAEGLGHGYRRDDNFRLHLNNNTIIAKTYIATHLNNEMAPFDWYLSFVLAGAREHNLPGRYVQNLLQTTPKPDDCPVRLKSAMQILNASGYASMRDVFG